jgi:hypothetical protein
MAKSFKVPIWHLKAQAKTAPSGATSKMYNTGQKIEVGEICCPDGAWLVGGVSATKMPLLAELGGINDSRV